MVLRGLGTSLFDQDDLYNENHAHSFIDPASMWASGPDGVTYTLNHRRPAGTTPFALSEQSTEDAISRAIVWSIFKYGLAPVALVSGDDHWIVVHGFNTSANPSSPNDTSYTIHAFDVRDPEPAANRITVPPVPPHSATDGCGSGGPNGSRGQAPQQLTYSEWQDNYMTGVPAGH